MKMGRSRWQSKHTKPAWYRRLWGGLAYFGIAAMFVFVFVVVKEDIETNMKLRNLCESQGHTWYQPYKSRPICLNKNVEIFQ